MGRPSAPLGKKRFVQYGFRMTQSERRDFNRLAGHFGLSYSDLVRRGLAVLDILGPNAADMLLRKEQP